MHPVLSLDYIHEEPFQLTTGQQSLLTQLRNTLPSLILSETGVALDADELQFCNDRCLTRYLTATHWDIHSATTRLLDTLKWRREFRPDQMDDLNLKEQLQSGKVYLNGFDKFGHPIVHMVLSRKGNSNHEQGLRYSIYLIEQAFKIAPKGIDKVCLIIDFRDMVSQVPMHITKKWISILSTHYPERLAHAFMVNPAWYVWMCFKIVGYLIDPATKTKIHFADTNKMRQSGFSNSDETLSTELIPNDPSMEKGNRPEGFGSWIDLRHYIPSHMLESRLEGSFQFDFDKDVYWSVFKERIASLES